MNLSQPPPELTEALRKALHLSEMADIQIQWSDPHAPARILVEVWSDAGADRPDKRYTLSKTFVWSDAVEHVRKFESAGIRHTLVDPEEVERSLFAMEMRLPSAEFLRTGRIRQVHHEMNLPYK